MGIIQPASELVLKVRVKQLLDAHGKMAVKPFDHKRQRLAILCVDLSQSEVHLMRESGVLKETVRSKFFFSIAKTFQIIFLCFQLRAMKSAMSKRARLRLIFDDFKVLNEENTRETPENDAQPKASVLSLENPPATLSRDSEALDELQQSRIHIFVILLLLAMFAMNIFLS